MISVRVHEIRMILENVAAQNEPAESAIVPNDFVLWSAGDAIPLAARVRRAAFSQALTTTPVLSRAPKQSTFPVGVPP